VAERHYLSRPTFYRRLHLGWELLAARLGPIEHDRAATAGGPPSAAEPRVTNPQ
jgi:hypothetical protein